MSYTCTVCLSIFRIPAPTVAAFSHQNLNPTRLLGNIISKRTKVTVSKGKYLPHAVLLFGWLYEKNSTNKSNTFAGLSLLTPNMHRDVPAEKQISGIGAQCNSTGEISKAGKPIAGCGQAEGIKARVITDSEGSTGLWGRDYYEFGHWQWGHYRGEKKTNIRAPLQCRGQCELFSILMHYVCMERWVSPSCMCVC